jgi:hypothetical protein
VVKLKTLAFMIISQKEKITSNVSLYDRAGRKKYLLLVGKSLMVFL